jgi:SAM-dependent methyltransferase
MNKLTEDTLVWSATVANNRMNRLRGLLGVNSYEKDLKLHIPDTILQFAETHSTVSWLDVGCGVGKALIEASTWFSTSYPHLQVDMCGIDLVDDFLPLPAHTSHLQFITQSIHTWSPTKCYELITAVHSFHYFGDKLAVLQKLLACLSPDGLFVGQVDLSSVYVGENSQEKNLASCLRKAGATYNTQTKILRIKGQLHLLFPYRFLYADDQAGKNYKGQEGVRGYYENV